MKTIVFLLVLVIFASSEVFAKLKITNLSYQNQTDTKGKLLINFAGNLREAPELKVRDNILQVTMPETIVWPQIDKKASLGEKFDTDLKAYQFDKDTVRVRAILPYSVASKVEQVSLTIKDGQIELTFPKQPTVVKAPKKKVLKPKAIAKAPEVKVQKREIAEKKEEKAEYDEKYLDYLLAQKKAEKSEKDISKPLKAELNQVQKEILDEVKTEAAAPLFGSNSDEPMKEKQFSVMSYIAKYIAFLGIILLGIYGAVRLMKKGVLKKGKLGFLNNTDIITVLSTTYIAPKKSLMLVKVHDRVLLLGNSDSGLSFLTEVNDTTGLLKEGEKKVSGSNFDSTIGKVDIEDIGIKVKEKENPFAGYESLIAEGPKKKEGPKFSSQIKEKIKNLKPLNQ